MMSEEQEKPSDQKKKRPQTKRRRYTDIYKDQDLEKKNRRESYAKLFLALLGPLIIIIYILWAYQTSNSNKAREIVYHSLHPFPPHSNLNEFLSVEKEKEKKEAKKQPWKIPQKMESRGVGTWHQSLGKSWQGHCPEQLSLLVIEDFPEWKNYSLEFELKLINGSLSLALRGMQETSIFSNFLSKLEIAPNPRKWHKVRALAQGARLELEIEGITEILTREDTSEETPGIMGFILQPFTQSQQQFPASVQLRNIRIRQE